MKIILDKNWTYTRYIYNIDEFVPSLFRSYPKLRHVKCSWWDQLMLNLVRMYNNTPKDWHCCRCWKVAPKHVQDKMRFIVQ